MKKYVSALIVILSLTSCDFLTSAGQQPQLLWQIPISNGRLIEGAMSLTIVQDQVIALGIDGNKSTLFGVNRNTGNKVWQWSDFFLSDKSVLVDYLHDYNNILVVNNRLYNYGINTLNGQTLWSNETSRNTEWGSQGATGVGRTYFFSTINDSANAILGNILTGKERAILKYPKSISPYWIVPIIRSSDTLLVMTLIYGEASTSFRNKTYLALFNLTSGQKIYELLQREAETPAINVRPDGLPIIDDNRIFTAIGQSIQCNDLLTGKLMWRTNTDYNFWLSGIIQADKKIIGCSSLGTLYALKQEDGQILWQTKVPGSSRTPFFMNGIIYIIGGDDGLLYAIDATDGKILWKIASPDNASNKQTFFTGVVTGKDGKIYASSYLNLYCYKAAR